jgi:peptidoglycan hydrolase CwlO-like protein
LKINNEQEKQQAIARARELSTGSEHIEKQIEDFKAEIQTCNNKMSSLKDQVTKANENIKTLTTQKAQAAKTNAKELAEIKAALADYTIGA